MYINVSLKISKMCKYTDYLQYFFIHCKFDFIKLPLSDVNECDASPCHNNGTCINNAGSYICTCAAGWEGYNCEEGTLNFYFNFSSRIK